MHNYAKGPCDRDRDFYEVRIPRKQRCESGRATRPPAANPDDQMGVSRIKWPADALLRCCMMKDPLPQGSSNRRNNAITNPTKGPKGEDDADLSSYAATLIAHQLRIPLDSSCSPQGVLVSQPCLSLF